MSYINNVVDFYNKGVVLLNEEYKKNGQGAVRDAVGKLYETLCYNILQEIDPSLKVLKNDYLTLYSKSGNNKLDNIQVDWHVYKKDKLILIIECKTYLDVCYLKRAIDDFETIRKIKKNVPAIVFAGQDAVGKDTWNYYNEEYEFETFFLNMTKKRSSSKPIFKTCDPLDETEIKRFVKYVSKIISK
jgi:hypothetical protein